MKSNEIRKPTPNEFDDVIASCICKLNEKEMFVVLSLIAMNKDYQARIDKAIEYIEGRFYLDKETGGYHLTHTFDSSNLYELLKILDKGV